MINTPALLKKIIVDLKKSISARSIGESVNQMYHYYQHATAGVVGRVLRQHAKAVAVWLKLKQVGLQL